MSQYLDKADVMAKINDWRDSLFKCILSIPLDGRDKADATLEYEVLGKVISYLDTLEVKEVNIEKELDEWMKYGPHTNYPWCTIPDAIKITAEHFFELGLETKLKEQKANE